MSLKAGVATTILQPRQGTDLVGYGVIQHSLRIHDPLHARAIVLANDIVTIAICSIEVCFFTNRDVMNMRTLITQQCAIPWEHIFLCATHTHAAPAFYETDHWDRAPAESVAEAVLSAYESLQPASIGIGFGQLQTISINRRFLNRPIDPSVCVVRIDSSNAQPMGLLSNFANHAVVLGYDNQHISGDWPGCSSAKLEAEFGNGFVALFSQGGAGDVNPVTASVRQRLVKGYPVEAVGSTSFMYKRNSETCCKAWNIGDRAGGTFDEMEILASEYNAEVMRVWRSIEMTETPSLWTNMTVVSAGEMGSIVPATHTTSAIRKRFQHVVDDLVDHKYEMEITLIGMGSAIIVGHPGETFSENAIVFRKRCQQMGIAHPFLITYANGWFSYLPPQDAYIEGGYEVEVAESIGISPCIQDRILQVVLPYIEAYQRYHVRTPA